MGSQKLRVWTWSATFVTSIPWDMGTSTVSMGKSLFPLLWSLFQSRSFNCTWLVHVRWKKRINPRWWWGEPMAMQPAIARQNGRGVWLYNSPPATASQICSKEATKRAVHSTDRNSTRSHISGSRGYESNQVRSLLIFYSYCKYGNQINHAVLWRGTTRNQDSRGIRPRGVNRIYQAQGEPWGSSVAWVLSRKWFLVSIQLWTDQAKRGLNNVGQVNPKRLLFKQKVLWPASRDIQVVKPGKCGRRGPASRLTNVWNGHPAGPCLRWGDASGGMGSDSDRALQPRGGVR